MITHVWSMTFAADTIDEQRAAFVAAMAALPSLIDGIESFKSGLDLGLNPGNAGVVIVAEFADADAWRAYIGAPAHVAFVEEHVNPLCATWSAVQFDASTTS